MTVLSVRQDRSRAVSTGALTVTHVTNRPTASWSQATARSDSSHSRTVRDVPKFVIDVMLKPEIHDPQGEAIARACRRLGFGEVAGVRQGKRFEVELSGPVAQDQITELAAELLANPVIEQFSVHPG